MANRPKRIRCLCCYRLMGYTQYKPGDTVRRKTPIANVCVDCKPGETKERLWQRHWNDKEARCVGRGCTPAPVIDRLAELVNERREKLAKWAGEIPDDESAVDRLGRLADE